MQKSPAFQFYAADYLADENVVLMTMEEEGCYIRLLAYCWREGSIPSDGAKLTLLCKGTVVTDLVKSCFSSHPNVANRLIHLRLELERKKQKTFKKNQSRKGVLSGNARRKRRLSVEPGFNRGSTQSNSSFASSSSSLSSSSFASSINTEPTTNSKENTTPLPAPSALVPVALWFEFVEMRKKIRKPLTERAVHLIHGRLQKFKNEGQDPVEVLEQSIRNCWQDIFPVREERNGATKTDLRGQRTVSAITRVLGGSGEVAGPVRPALPTSH